MINQIEHNRALQDELQALRHRVAELEQECMRYRAAAEAARYHKAAVEAAFDGIAFLDSQGNYIYMNQAHAEAHGYQQPDQLLGKSWMVVTPEQELTTLEKEVGPAMSRNGCWRGELINKRADGSLHPTEVSLMQVEGGGSVCIARDISKRKQAAAELYHSQELLQLVMDHIPQTIFWKDRNLVYLGCNRRFAEHNGLASPADIIGKTDYDLPWAALADAYNADDRRVMENDTPKLNYEEPLPLPTGTGWVRTSKIPLHDGTGAVVAVLGLYEDITAQKQAEAERLRLKEEVIQAQAAALAELSTPLIPITDSVMVMPLIGKVDARRAQQVIETLLSGLVASKARTAILDITGVALVDTHVASALLRAAQAVKLIGAQVVLTGIRPEVAQTLVALGVDLSSIITSSNLQRAIAHALARS